MGEEGSRLAPAGESIDHTPPSSGASEAGGGGGGGKLRFIFRKPRLLRGRTNSHRRESCEQMCPAAASKENSHFHSARIFFLQDAESDE